jgi:hypothetical protein
MIRRDRGAGGIFIFVVLLLAMVFIVAVFMLSRVSTSVDARAQTATSLAVAAAALEQFASQTGRLPCPARPDVDDGLAVPNAASANCTYPQGVLPWATIGMRREDAIDGWGWKISYRVYSGNTGMTQDQGASMVNCDTSPTLGSSGRDSTTGLCLPTHATLPSDFLSGKGLDVTDFGVPYSAAYVLLSHGPSGFGAYTSAGTQNPNNPKSTAEKNNLKATGPFTLTSASSPDTSPDDNNHYDDILVYRTVDDLAKRANLAARDWPDNLISLTFNASSLQNVLGQPPSAGSLGVASLRFYGATVSAGSGNISYDVVGGNAGIGVAGGGNAISGSESMSVTFAKPANKLALSLNDFGGTTVPFFGFFPETAQLKFYSGSTLRFSTTVSGCQSSIPTGGPLASFTVTPGVTFDQVQITPFFSSFFLSALKSCAPSDPTCLTALDTGASPPAGNHCAWP